MRTVEGFKDYELLDADSGERLERWGDVVLIRPDPQVIWSGTKRDKRWKDADALYHRSNRLSFMKLMRPSRWSWSRG